MKPKLIALSRQYVSALRRHLQQGRQASLASARGLGSQTLAAGLSTLDLAKLHERTLVAELSPGFPPNKRAALTRRAAIFFAAAIVPIEETPQGRQEATTRLKKIVETLSERTVELAASNLELKLEIAQRKAVEAALKKSEGDYAQSLKQSARLQEQLRRLTRQILSAQEVERKEISRELHDVIGQTLTGINVRLAALKKEATLSTKTLERNIAKTQRLVESSVDVVHRFARDLRPAVLDDLGLIPALHSLMKSFTARSGVRTRLTAFAGTEELDTARRTIFFRVAQEALNNVAKHAKASEVEVHIEKLSDGVCMKIKDDGKSFNVERTLHANAGKRLGLLGMKERLEMVGGSFTIESAPGQGTTMRATIPFRKTLPRGLKSAVKPRAIKA